MYRVTEYVNPPRRYDDMIQHNFYSLAKARQHATYISRTWRIMGFAVIGNAKEGYIAHTPGNRNLVLRTVVIWRVNE